MIRLQGGIAQGLHRHGTHSSNPAALGGVVASVPCIVSSACPTCQALLVVVSTPAQQQCEGEGRGGKREGILAAHPPPCRRRRGCRPAALGPPGCSRRTKHRKPIKESCSPSSMRAAAQVATSCTRVSTPPSEFDNEATVRSAPAQGSLTVVQASGGAGVDQLHQGLRKKSKL